MNRTVKQVSELAGISVRTLHYYDEIGLLVPSARSGGNYRLYSDRDLLRLQQVLIGRELGLPLDDIRRSLDDRAFDLHSALVEQRRLLQQRADRTAEMIRSIDAALAVRKGDINMKDIFNGFDPAVHETEAEARWGQTAAFTESSQRIRRYTAEDWKRHRAEQERIYADATSAMRAGISPSDDRAVDIAERHRLLIDRWFYPCSRVMHRGLSEMYLQDERFKMSIDAHGEGLTTFLCAAIAANADRA